MPPLTYPQTHHMKTPAEFERCYARKRSVSDGLLIVYACENELAHPRLGCSVSKKVGNAVVRNRYKRLFREAFRLSQHELPPGVDLILIPRPGPYPALDALRASLVKLAKQASRKLSEGKRPTPPVPLPSPRPASVATANEARDAGEEGKGEKESGAALSASEVPGSVSPFPSGRGVGGVGPASAEASP